MSDSRNEQARETMRKLRDKRMAMGICILCSGMIDDTQYIICSRCRAKKREENAKYRENLKKLHEKCVPIEPEKKIVPEDHKCWSCVWGTFVGTGFYCPLFGKCVKDEEKAK